MLALLLAGATICPAQDADVEALRAELARQRAKLEEQSRQLEQQARQLDRLAQLIESSSAAPPPASQKPVAPTAPSAPPTGAKATLEPTPWEPTLPATGALQLPEADSQDIIDAQPIAGLGRGEEFTDNRFLKSVPLFGSEWRFSFGGYSKVDMIHDFSGSGDPTQFLLSEIPVDGNPQAGSYTEFQLRETRFNFEVRDTSPGTPPNKFYTEFDFFDSNNTSPRLRHAYFQYGNFVVGQTWTTLTELRQLPLFLDFAAGDSLFGGRTVQVRWEQEVGSNFDWAIALENYSDSGIFNSADLSGTARSNFPLLVGRVGYEWDHALIMLGGSIGENRWDGSDGVSDDQTLRWNVATGGRVYLTEANTHFLGFGASYGEGAPRDILTFGNAGTPSAVLDADGDLKNVTSWNADLGLHLKWSDKFSSNFGLAYAQLGSTGLLPERSIRTGSAFHGNLIYDFTDHIRGGIELMLGEQELVNGRSGTAQRIQASVFYYF